MHLKGADSLNGMLDLGYRLHSMPAVVDMSHMARCGTTSHCKDRQLLLGVETHLLRASEVPV